ncbi:MAG: flavodoxin domain-containing protein [Pseudomonadota bacterium]
MYILDEKPRERSFPKGDRLLVAYASQTGTAAALAERVYQHNTHNCDLVDLACIDIKDLERYGRQIFILSTFGEGNAPTKVLPFYRSLCQQSLNLNGVQFSVLGLGNNQYEYFCGFGTDIFNRLIQLGAEPRLPITKVNRNNAAMILHWWSKLHETFGINQAEDCEWSIGTVMDISERSPGEFEAALYIQSLQFSHAQSLLIKYEQEGKKSEDISVKIISEKNDPFTRVVIAEREYKNSTKPLIRLLSLATPGDKWQVKVVA